MQCKRFLFQCQLLLLLYVLLLLLTYYQNVQYVDKYYEQLTNNVTVVIWYLPAANGTYSSLYYMYLNLFNIYSSFRRRYNGELIFFNYYHCCKTFYDIHDNEILLQSFTNVYLSIEHNFIYIILHVNVDADL